MPFGILRVVEHENGHAFIEQAGEIVCGAGKRLACSVLKFIPDCGIVLEAPLIRHAAHRDFSVYEQILIPHHSAPDKKWNGRDAYSDASQKDFLPVESRKRMRAIPNSVEVPNQDCLEDENGK